jgi:RimJ/RimL family protein N-acetyltransferase
MEMVSVTNKALEIKRGSSKIFARLADESDCEDVFNWENDPQTRAMSVNKSLFTFENHLDWFKKSLKNINRFLYTATIDGEKAGLVRFDKVFTNQYESSLILNPKFRGFGFSKDILMSGTSLFLNSNKSTERLKASIRKENIASIRCFTSLGYIFENAHAEYNFYYFPVKPTQPQL